MGVEVRVGVGLTASDPGHEAGRGKEADGVRDDGERRADDPDEPTAEGRAGGLGDGPADLQLGVALQDLVALQEARQVAHVGHVEEDGQHPVHEADHVQLLDGQDAQLPGDGDRAQAEGASDVAR